MKFACGSLQRMATQNDHFSSPLTRQRFEALAQINFLRHEQVKVKSSHATKRRCFTKNERAWRPPGDSADQIPYLHPQPGGDISCSHLHQTAPGQTLTGLNLRSQLAKKFRRRKRIRVDKHQPIARGRFRAAIARAPNLVHRFKDHHRTRRPRQFSGPVRGIIIANNKFTFPLQPGKRGKRCLDAAKRSDDQLLLIKRRNDDRDFHAANSRSKTAKNSTAK